MWSVSNNILNSKFAEEIYFLLYDSKDIFICIILSFIKIWSINSFFKLILRIFYKQYTPVIILTKSYTKKVEKSRVQGQMCALGLLQFYINLIGIKNKILII